MSSKTSTRKTRTTTPSDTTDRRSTTQPEPSTALVRTDTEDKLWAALHAHPNGTATELSVSAKIGKSTAQKILAKWAADGSAVRTAGIAEGGRRAADHWAIAGGTDNQAEPKVSEGTPGPSQQTTDDDANGGESERLASGALRGMVEDHLRDHPSEQFGPTAIAKALGDRSSGAVSNALDKLVADGVAVKIQDKPRRFSLASAKQVD